MHPADAAAQVARESPLVGDFPRTGIIAADQKIKQRWLRAGWPSAQVTITVTHPESVDASGWHRPARTQEQPATIFPESWARRFAALTGRKLSEVVKGRYTS